MRATLLLAALLVSGCAYHPIVDHKSSTNSGAYHQDLAECQQLADQQAGPGTNAAVGAGLGYILGQVLARATGNREIANEVGRGAAVLGAAQGAGAGVQANRDLVRNCLRGRGHNVLN